MPQSLPIRRVVLYKHGVGYFERRGKVTGSETLHFDFKARDMNDVLKSMTVLDLSGGSVSAVSYDSTKPLEQLLKEATIRIPDSGSLTALLGQVKGTRVRVRVGKEQVDTYVGEAMLDTMKPDDKRFVPYAVELGCVVSMEEDTEEGSVFRAVVNRGILTVEFHKLKRTLYTVRNKAKRAQTLFLEHPRSGMELTNTQAPAETTDNFFRFQLELTAGGDKELTVTERSTGHRSWYFSGTDSDEVSFLLSSGYIDERVAQGARELIALRERMAPLNQEESRLKDEKAQLFKDQERIRANIESLKSGASQRDLAERFVAKLNEQEDRLEVIGREMERVAREKKETQAEVNRKLQELMFTKDLGTPST
jgi:hypothetical protein